MNKKELLLALASKEDIEHITEAIMKFVEKTSLEVGIGTEDVATSSLVALLLYYLKNSSEDKAVAVANLMGVLSSVFMITSSATNWIEVNDEPSGGIN